MWRALCIRCVDTRHHVANGDSVQGCGQRIQRILALHCRWCWPLVASILVCRQVHAALHLSAVQSWQSWIAGIETHAWSTAGIVPLQYEQQQTKPSLPDGRVVENEGTVSHGTLLAAHHTTSLGSCIGPSVCPFISHLVSQSVTATLHPSAKINGNPPCQHFHLL